MKRKDRDIDHQIERLIDRMDHMEKHHQQDHEKIMRVVEDSNNKLSRAFWLVGTIVTLGTIVFEVMSYVVA